jgi:RNA recognition motif-containing protein
MKVKSKNLTTDATNRISALKRLSGPTSMNKNVHQRLSAPTTPMVTDARQLLSNRNKPVFDARQLLSRQSSKTKNTSLIVQRDVEPEEEEDDDDDDQEMVVLQRSNNGRLTSGALDRKKKTPSVSTESISFTKTISNTSYDRPSHNPTPPSALSDQKFVISFANDQYRKRARSPSPPPVIKRLNNASIQTATSSSSRLTNRRDSDEPPRKQQSLSKESLKQTSTSTRPKQSSSTNTDPTTILITNLQSSVTEDDVIELFGEIGSIKEIKTLSRGCVQLVYSKEEYAKQAVANYHNRLLDGQLMYVSLQQPSYSSKSSKTASSSSNTDNESSNKYSLDPSFIRQALFNPSTNTTNPVQFQVKL